LINSYKGFLEQFENNETTAINQPGKIENNPDSKNDISYSLSAIDYHESSEDIEKEEGYGINLMQKTIFDTLKQQYVNVRVPKTLSMPVYNNPGIYKYGYDNYVPNYKDSLLLSSSR